jgi:hypothetical protein
MRFSSFEYRINMLEPRPFQSADWREDSFRQNPNNHIHSDRGPSKKGRDYVPQLSPNSISFHSATNGLGHDNSYPRSFFL